MTNSAVIVVAVCGLPGSGKSRLCRQLQKEHGSSCCRVIEYDAVQEKHADLLAKEEATTTADAVVDTTNKEDFDLDAWRKTRVTALQELETLLMEHINKQLHVQQQQDNNTKVSRDTTAPPKPHIIIMDDNFHLRSMRKRIYQVCQKSVVVSSSTSTSSNNDSNSNNNLSTATATTTTNTTVNIYFAVIWIKAPIDLCLERNRSRGPSERKVPNLVIHKMAATAELPDDNSNKQYRWERITLILDQQSSSDDESNDEKTMLKTVQDFLYGIPTSGLYEPVPLANTEQDEIDEERRLEEERRKTLASTRHQADKVLRQCVQSVAKMHPKSAKRANQIRQVLLKNVHQQRDEDDDVHDLKQLFLNKFMAEEDTVEWSSEDKDQLWLTILVESEREE